MINKSNVLEIIRKKGPVIPRDIMRELGGDTFLIGAVLSQLKSSNKIRVSNTKIGGSPVYYLPEQKDKLKELYKHLKNKEKEAYDLLKEKGILQDSKLEPAIRVALRNIKDFAKPVEVKIKGEKILFWKWFMLSNKEAEQKIREIFSKNKPKTNQPQERETKKEEQKTLEEKENDQDENEKESKEKEKRQETTKKSSEEVDEDDEFYNQVKNFFDKNDVEITNQNIVRKNREIKMEIKIPSAVGKIKFYCKARNIKTIRHGELSTAYVEGQNKKLPILYITTGDLTNRAEELVETEFKNITVKKI